MPDADETARLHARIDRLEATVRRRASEWEETVNAMSDWVCIIDLDFRIVRTNRAVETILGVPRDKVVGRTCHDLVHGSDMPVGACPIPRMIKGNRRAQTELPLPDGRWLSITADPLTGEDGRLKGAVHMVRDITELKTAQAERERLIRQLERSLREVKTLKGLIPICATCRRIRDDHGAWNPLEAFVRNNFDADFSHGLCPECARREYDEYDL